MPDATPPTLDVLGLAEDILVLWIKSFHLSFVGDIDETQRVYRGFENSQVSQSKEDQSIPYREGEQGVSEEPSEGQESSILQAPCVVVSAELAAPVNPGFVGNWHITVYVDVISSAYDSTHRDHSNRVNETLTVFFRDTSLDELKAFDQRFDCARIVPSSLSKHKGPDCWVTRQQLTLVHFTPQRVPDE